MTGFEIKTCETPEQAMFRELNEELGLEPQHVEVLGVTRDWLSYRLPQRYIRPRRGRVCIGQKQKWFVLRLLAEDSRVRFDTTLQAEFDGWRWVDYGRPLTELVEFTREVYRSALLELAPVLRITSLPLAG